MKDLACDRLTVSIEGSDAKAVKLIYGRRWQDMYHNVNLKLHYKFGFWEVTMLFAFSSHGLQR